MTCPLNGKPCVKYKCFHITEKHGEKVETYMVCEDCLYISATSKIKMSDEDISCDSCGLKLEEVLKGSRMGCARCYDCFEGTIEHVIKAVQDADRHVGRIPTTWKMEQAEKTDPLQFLTELKQKYRIAVKSERYERASALNSHIIRFEELLERHEKEGRSPPVQKEIATMIYDIRESELSQSLK
jgi:protein-arginine kinase activator protein McsA